MAKIRGIKPEFWTDEDIVELSVPARLLFIGLWNLACDNGHVTDKPKQIKMRLLPADDVDVDLLLDELADNGRLERKAGTVTILNFAKHQKPHRRWWTVCDVPFCTVPEDAPEQGFNRGGAPSGSTSQPGDNSGATVVHGGTTADVDGEGDGEGELKVKVPRKSAASRLPEAWRPSEKHWERRHDGIDVQREADKFRLHAEANDRRQVNWNAAFSQWLLNARPTRVPSAVADPSQLPPVEESWMRRRPQ